MKSRFVLVTAIFIIIFGSLAGTLAYAQQANQPVLAIEKRVKNLSRGELSFATATSAVAGERVQFQITVNTFGSNTTQNNVTIRDSLSSRLVLSSGNVNLFNSAGFNLGQMVSGTSQVVVYETIASGDAAAAISNTAFVRSDELADRLSTANVVITGSAIVRDLEVTNRVLNVTAGETVFQNATAAVAGDRLRFQITIRSIGNATVTDIQARDLLPSRLALAGAGGDIVVNGLTVGSLRSGEVRTVTFDATVTSGDAVNLVNPVRVTSGEVAEKEVRSTVVVRAGLASAVRNLLISERALNISKNESVYSKTVFANAGDVLRFEIRVDALGHGPQSNVTATANLSTRLTFLGGNQNLTGAGVVLGTLNALEARTINFEARVNAGSPEVLNVTASVRSDDAVTVNDSVTINIGNVAVTVPPASQVAGKTIVPPRTGPNALLAILPAFLTTLGYGLFKRQKALI